MHILFLTDNFPPEVNAPASRTFEHCRQWVSDGHRVTVVTCAPNFPHGRLLGTYRNRLWQAEDMDGICVIRVWTFIARNQGFAKRIVDYLSFMATSFLAALFVRKPDIIVGTSPQFFAACAAFAVSIIKRRPWVFELRDLWPESISAVGAMKDGPMLRALERLELFLYRKANAIVAVTHSFKRRLIGQGIQASKIHVVTNGVDTKRFFARPKDRGLELELGLEGKFVAGYIGTHGMAHGLGTLLEAASLLKQTGRSDEVRILMLGDGAQRASIEERAKAEALDNVVFVPSVSKELVANYWSLLDVSIIHLRRKETFKSVIPSKIFECMAMGLPLLLGIEGESAEIVERAGCGLLFEPENAAELAAGIWKIQHDGAVRKRLRNCGLAVAHEYDRVTLAKNMLEILETTSRC